MKNAIFITVRSDSSRLPDKALRLIRGHPTIEWVVRRARSVPGIDTVVLCTTERAVDDPLLAIADRCGIRHFRGSLDDKLERWHGAVRAFGLDYFVTFDGDDLLCDPELISCAVAQMEAGKCDFIRAPQGLVCGAFTYCIRATALEKVCEIKGTGDTEMMWVYFEDTGLFAVQDLDVPDPLFIDDGIRMTLDYAEDLAFFTRVFDEFPSEQNDVPLRTIVPFLRQHPEIPAINSFRHREWRENQIRKTKLVIKESPSQ